MILCFLNPSIFYLNPQTVFPRELHNLKIDAAAKKAEQQRSSYNTCHSQLGLPCYFYR